MHPPYVSALQLVLLGLWLLFSSCGRIHDPASVALPGDQEYVLTLGFPYGTQNFGPAITAPGYRLQFEGDSARVFNPFAYGEAYFRAYAADSTVRFSDSLNMTYQIEEDSTLLAVVRSGGTWDAVQQYRPAKKMVYQDLPDDMDGETYRITIDGTDYVMYFDEMTGSRATQAVTVKTMKVITLANGPELKILKSRTAYGMGGEKLIVTISRGDERGRDQLMLSNSEAGRLQGHLLRESENRVEGPIYPEELPSVIPDSVPTNNLINILNTGRITVTPPPPEPDSIGIEYANLNGEGDSKLITHAELDRLDFEFSEDGGYTLFAGNRMLQRGKWKFSEGRQLIQVISGASMHDDAQLIEAYAPGMLTFSLPIQLQTREPKGVRLTSFYTPRVQVKFELQSGNAEPIAE